MIADSFAFAGAKPAAWMAAALAALPQSSLVPMTAPSLERTRVSVGSGSGLAMPAAASDGPDATTTTVLLAAPPMMKPAIITSLLVPTSPRVDKLTTVPEATAFTVTVAELVLLALVGSVWVALTVAVLVMLPAEAV